MDGGWIKLLSDFHATPLRNETLLRNATRYSGFEAFGHIIIQKYDFRIVAT